MKPAIKALLYLEISTLINKLRNVSKHKLQALLLLIIAIILVIALLSAQTGQIVEFPDHIYSYSDTIISLLVLGNIISAVFTASGKLPVHVPAVNVHILLALPLTSQQLCFYYFWKQFFTQLSFSLLLTYG